MARRAVQQNPFEEDEPIGALPTIEQVTTAQAPCARCGHSPLQHIAGSCDAVDCECAMFLYPSEDDEPPVFDQGTGQAYLPSEEFAPTPAQREIGPLMEAYVSARDDRMSLTKEETQARTDLLNAMHRHGLNTFSYAGRTAIIDTSEKLKVTSAETAAALDLEGEEE